MVYDLALILGILGPNVRHNGIAVSVLSFPFPAFAA